MALGQSYDNNKKKEEYTPTVYSKFGMANKESSVDPSMLSFSFWGNGMLKLSMSAFIESTGTWDHKNQGFIHLSHDKAKILADEIDLYLQDPDAYNNLGIPSGDGMISISNGKEINGTIMPCLIIRKINEQGSVDSMYLYEFKSDHHYSIRNYNEEDASFDKIYHNNLEIIKLRDILLHYYESMSGAAAYGNMYYERFSSNRTYSTLIDIAKALGIEYETKANSNPKGRSTSVFDNAKGRNYDSKDLEDIEDMM